MLTVTLPEHAETLIRELASHNSAEPVDPGTFGPMAPWDAIEEAAREHNRWAETRTALMMLAGNAVVAAAVKAAES